MSWGCGTSAILLLNFSNQLLLLLFLFEYQQDKLLQSMYTLYHHFLQKVKEQQIEKYNQKHRAYLIRAGKIKDQQPSMPRRNMQRNENENSFNKVSNNNMGNQKVEKNQQPENKPRRQREFNRPARAPQNTQQQKLPTPPSTRPSRQQKPQNIPSSNPIPSSNSEQRYQQQDRPIKQNKLTQQQRQYLMNQGSKPIQNSFQTENKTNKVNPVIKPNVSKAIQKQRVISSQPAQPEQFPTENVNLIECEICGRSFNENVLKKHQKICEKVFQQKRKPFEVKVIDEQAQKLKKKSTVNEDQTSKNADKKSKWKAQSEVFRNMLKSGRGEVVQNAVQLDDRVECPHCGRKFNDKAASRHIEFCSNKAKKMQKK